MCQWCQVARSTEGTQFIYYGMNTQIIKVHQSLYHFGTYTTIALAEPVCFQQQHQPYHIFRHLIAHTASMRANQVLLQLSQLVVINTHIAQRTEACIDTIIGFALAEDIV